MSRRQHAVRKHESKLKVAAKFGWFAKGSLYVTLGVLATMAAFGAGGSVEGGKGILEWVATKPFGQAMLAFAALGFTGYSLWRFTQAAVNPQPDDAHTLKRIGWALSGIAHASLAFAAMQLLLGGGSKGKRMWVDQALQESWGPILIGALGVFVIGVGLYQFKKAYELRFMSDIDSGQTSPEERTALRTVGRIGLAGRGVVFPVIGYFLIKAAMNASPSQAKGVGGALHTIAEAGWIWLALVAIGMLAYGILNLAYARYRTPDVA